MKKGFTLIELLAVIVILAIIALIATPIILNIIGDTKKESDKRSIEMYGDAIKNAVAKSMLDGAEITPGNLSEELLSEVEYEGSKVECETHEIYSDGTIYLAECTVNDVAVEYEYGEKKIMPGKYYGWWSQDKNLKIGGELPEDLSLTPPSDKKIYLGIDTDGSKIKAAYACFKMNNENYCLKGADETAVTSNHDMMREAFSETGECYFDEDGSDYNDECHGESIIVQAHPSGDVSTIVVDTSYCYVFHDGTFYCYDE